MKIGVKKEVKVLEGRVALVPSDVETLVKRGFDVLVQNGAGDLSGYSDWDYLISGATIGDVNSVWRRDLVLGVKEPIEKEFKYFREDQMIFSYMHLAACPDLVKALVESGATAVALENVEMEGRFPGLDPMSTIAGQLSYHLAIRNRIGLSLVEGLDLEERYTEKASKVVVVGGGVAGMAAARSFHERGTEVVVFDISLDKIAKIQREGITAKLSDPATIANELKDADVLIGAVLIPGKSAPKVVSREAVLGMAEGSVVIDIAIDQGGCIETARLTDWNDPAYDVEGITHLGIPNLPGIVPRVSSIAVSNVVLPQAIKLIRGDYDEDLLSAVSITGFAIVDDRIK
jgi:alanine dehydrogenase